MTAAVSSGGQREGDVLLAAKVALITAPASDKGKPLEVDVSSVPSDWGALTPQWLTAALQHDFPGVEVTDLEIQLRDDGTNRRTRLAVSYAAGAGPEVVFLKGEGAWRESHPRNGNMFNEPELFKSRLPLPVDHPHPYHVAIDRPALDYVIVMEDITRRGGDPRDGTRPLTVRQVENGVRALARLHSAYWNLAEGRPGLEWLQTWRSTEGWRASLGPGVPIGRERAVEVFAPTLRETPAEHILDLGMRSMQSFGTGPLTLLHSDPHVGNVYVLPGDEVGFLDWQVCRRGSWAMDLAYFVVSALIVNDRRASEEHLLDVYRTALDLPADDLPDQAEVRMRYAAAHPYGLAVWLATHSTDRSQGPEVCRALIERYAAALADSRSAEALDALGV